MATYTYMYPLAWHNIKGTIKAKTLELAKDKVKEIAKKHRATYGITDECYINVQKGK